MNNPVLALIRKNVLWYALTIVVTGTAAFIGVAITKHKLPAHDFMQFNIQLSAALVINVLSLGWFSQSINRFYHNMRSFLTVKRIVTIAFGNTLFISIPLFVGWWFIVGARGGILWPLFFMLVNAVQTTLLICRQASLAANQAAISETWRSGSLLMFLLLPIWLNWTVPVGYYWMCYCLSGLLGLILLLLLEMRHQRNAPVHKAETLSHNQPIRTILRFGLPLSVWLLITFVWNYADRWYIIGKHFPEGASADYVAIADIMMRGAGFMYSPVVASVYPILSQLYDSHKLIEVKKLIKQVLFYELLMMAGVAIAFWAIQRLVISILNINALPMDQFLVIGLGLLAVHSLFQMSAMLHKIAEMQLKTWLLALGGVVATSLIYILLYVIVLPQTLVAVLACFSAGYVFYAIFCAILYNRLVAKMNVHHGSL